MPSVGIFFASTSGRTESVADRIARHLTPLRPEMHRIESSQPVDLLRFDVLILGSPTYGRGQMHHEWLSWKDHVARIDLSEKAVGLFVLGDQRFHGRTFAGAVDHLCDLVQSTGTRPRAQWPTDGYHAPGLEQRAAPFPGLVVDEINQRRSTEQRVQRWCAQFLLECRRARPQTAQRPRP